MRSFGMLGPLMKHGRTGHSKREKTSLSMSRFRLHRTSVVDRPNLAVKHRARSKSALQQLCCWPLIIAMNHVEDQRAVHSPKTSREQIAWTLVGYSWIVEFEVFTVQAKVQTCANHIITISVRPPRAFANPNSGLAWACNSVLFSCHSHMLSSPHISSHIITLRALQRKEL